MVVSEKPVLAGEVHEESIYYSIEMEDMEELNQFYKNEKLILQSAPNLRIGDTILILRGKSIELITITNDYKLNEEYQMLGKISYIEIELI